VPGLNLLQKFVCRGVAAQVEPFEKARFETSSSHLKASFETSSVTLYKIERAESQNQVPSSAMESSYGFNSCTAHNLQPCDDTYRGVAVQVVYLKGKL
jgi:hypothetical protein